MTITVGSIGTERVARETRSFVVTAPAVPHPRATGAEFGSGSSRTRRYLAYKDQIGWAYKAMHGGKSLLTAPLTLELTIQHPAPLVKKLRKWDGVNVIKAIEDAMTGVCIDDDWGFVSWHVKVIQGEPECIYVHVTGSIEQEAV